MTTDQDFRRAVIVGDAMRMTAISSSVREMGEQCVAALAAEGWEIRRKDDEEPCQHCGPDTGTGTT